MPEPIPSPKACVFDLDGTLVDSLRDIAESLNHCLHLLGQPTFPMDDCRYLVGEGVPMLCQRALAKSSPHLVDRLAELVRPLYRTRALCHTRPYEGISELIRRLGSRGVKLGVLSNKPHDMTVRMVRAFWPDGIFSAVYGYIEEQHRKPSPVYLQRICEEVGVLPADTWLIGDTPTDIATAKAAGAIPVGVTWGFRAREDLRAAGAAIIADRPEELG